MKNKISAQISIAIVCTILVFAITLQFKSVVKNAGQGTISGLRASEIQVLYQKEKEKHDALYKDYQRLSSDLDKYKAASNDVNATTKILNEQLDNAEILAGIKEVYGQGVIIKMADSKKTVQPGTQEELYWLHDGDMLMVLNELKDAGAEAISLNDQRLTSISEVRCVGSVVSVNNVRLGEPFTIKAIGDSKTLESALLFRGGVVSELTSYGIEFEIKKAEDIVIPAYKGAINFKYAMPTTQVTKKGGAE
jgi:uncharacterized protein YlxW (UPF0749 family)